MPLYYFDVVDGTRQPDLEGVEFASLEEARAQAVKFAGELLRHQADLDWDGHDLRIEVFNGTRVRLFAIAVSATSLFPDP